jgi:type II secretory pathway component PulF
MKLNLDFVDSLRLRLVALALVFSCYLWIVFPIVANAIRQLGITLSAFSLAAFTLSSALSELWVLTVLVLGIVLAVEFRTSSRGLVALLDCTLCLVLLFMMLGVGLPGRA